MTKPGSVRVRVNDELVLEASAALAEWIDLYRADPAGQVSMQLVNRAVYYLPMRKKTSRLKIH